MAAIKQYGLQTLSKHMVSDGAEIAEIKPFSQSKSAIYVRIESPYMTFIVI